MQGILGKRMIDIMKMLEVDSMVSVSDLAERCGVTKKTIRLDLNRMAQMGIVNKVHGGAMLANSTRDIYPIVTRKQKHAAEKRGIAMKAMEMIEDGDIIYLDSGTTTLELAKCMNQQVIVITNDAMIAAELINHKSVTLYCTGGQLQRGNDSYIYVGPNVNQVIAKYHTNKCFMGCSALNFNYGLMVFSEIEAEIKQAIVKNTGKIICLADSSKFDRTAFRSFLALEDMDVCVTDQNVLQSHIELLQARNIEVEIANV